MNHITINNWQKTQHYKNRNPPWIRLYRDITDKYDKDGNEKKFHKMSDAAKLTFLMLLCLSPRYNNHIPFENEDELSHSLGIKALSLQPLVDAEYIQIDGNDAGRYARKNDSSQDSEHDSEERASLIDAVKLVDSKGKTILDSESASISVNETLATDTDTDTDTEKEGTEAEDRGSSLFPEFQRLYPVKNKLHQAMLEWNKLEFTYDQQFEILEKLELQIEHKNKMEAAGMFVRGWPDPDNYLKHGRWKDELEPIVQSGRDLDDTGPTLEKVKSLGKCVKCKKHAATDEDTGLCPGCLRKEYPRKPLEGEGFSV